MRIKSRSISVILMSFALAGFLFAQSHEQTQEQKKAHEAIHLKLIAAGKEAPAGDQIILEDHLTSKIGTAMFVSSEVSFDGKVVRGMPYSAKAIHETIQTLSDGNRIVRRTEAALYRDSEGRTRREQSLGAIGPWAVPSQEHRTILIRDPVAEQSYMLDPDQKVAGRQPQFSALGDLQAKKKPAKEFSDKVHATGKVVRKDAFIIPPSKQAPESREESLGYRMIEGLQAYGTRTMTMIPAGQIGNERPIEIVSERWYSPELDMTVMTRHSDPRTGETLYRLTDIRREEPDRSLFEIPADYKVVEKPIRFDILKKTKDE